MTSPEIYYSLGQILLLLPYVVEFLIDTVRPSTGTAFKLAERGRKLERTAVGKLGFWRGLNLSTYRYQNKGTCKEDIFVYGIVRFCSLL